MLQHRAVRFVEISSVIFTSLGLVTLLLSGRVELGHQSHNSTFFFGHIQRSTSCDTEVLKSPSTCQFNSPVTSSGRSLSGSPILHFHTSVPYQLHCRGLNLTGTLFPGWTMLNMADFVIKRKSLSDRYLAPSPFKHKIIEKHRPLPAGT